MSKTEKNNTDLKSTTKKRSQKRVFAKKSWHPLLKTTIATDLRQCLLRYCVLHGHYIFMDFRLQRVVIDPCNWQLCVRIKPYLFVNILVVVGRVELVSGVVKCVYSHFQK